MQRKVNRRNLYFVVSNIFRAMSLQRNNRLTGGTDIPWKKFVKESAEVDIKVPEEKIHRLNFIGNEAKAVYEEIVNQTSNANPMPGKLKTQSSERTKATNARTKRSQSSEPNNTRVTINTILKAVEQKDLKFLLKHVTLENVNLTDDFGWTPLMSAAYCGHLEIIEFLLSLGANRKAKDKSGLTAAQLALKRNYLSIVALLKKRSVDSAGKTSLEPMINNELEAPEKSELVEPLKDCNSTRKTAESCKEQPRENTGFYCEICDASFQHATPAKHETSTLHIFNSKPKLSYTMYGISKQNKGYQMLLNTGWDEQCGLGPSGKGIKYPIKTCLKTDRKGIGQSGEKEYRVTHFKAEDTSAVGHFQITKQKCFKKRDREKLLNREARKERALRIALS